MPRRSLVAAVLAVAGALAAIPAAAGPTPASPPIRSSYPFMRDAQGRAVFFHGVNAAWKHAPYYPPSSLFGDQKSYFDERDATFLAETGLTHVRLGVFFAGVMPERGRIDTAYLDRIAKIVNLLGRHGIKVLLDFHQDMYNEAFDGEGFPDWAVITDGIPATNCCGFPVNYFTPAASHAFDNFWLNRQGLQDQYAKAWVAVAKRFRNSSAVMGYDLFNEPWAGLQWPTCINVLVGCPAFENLVLQPFFEKIISAIRTVDHSHIAFWEAQQWTSGAGVQDWMGTLHPVRDPAANTGLSFHDYCTATLGLPEPVVRATDVPCDLSETLVFGTHLRAAERNGSTPLLSEFGSSDDVIDISRLADLADRNMVSWDYWAYANWDDPTGNVPEEGLFTDDLDRPGSLKEDKAAILIRTYPQAVAGTPLSFAFDPDTARFSLAYGTDPSIHAPTVVFVPVTFHYPRGYRVTVSGPARVVSSPNTSHLRLETTGSGVVTITVTPR
ncbi:MAG TPA: cellulase family glycosylhydrolase [Actinomycetota bacterium]|nr:cellulase family glycosylhydrolase [Actinomycetota bacterium]